ncbi:MAG: hypothetical protein ABI828_00460 [Actinomycetota bacterium]
MRTTGWMAGVTLAAVLTACSNSSTVTPTPTAARPSTPQHQTTPASATPAAPSQTAVAVEQHPPGDISDTIAYVAHSSTKGGFSIKVPEGWAETHSAAAVNFTDKLNTVNVSWTPATSAPTITSAKKTEVPMLQQSVLAFQLKSVTTATLPAGPAVLITYEDNSQPSAVTGKQYRETVLRYELFHNGQEKVLTLLSPVGADNVDPWRIVTESLQWK